MAPTEVGTLEFRPDAVQIEVEGKIDSNGEFVPHRYPIKKDGTEKIKIVK
jgi:hypothetical protein